MSPTWASKKILIRVLASKIYIYTHSQLEEVVRAETREVETTNVSVVVFSIHLRYVAVSIGSHEHIELLSHGVHLCYLSLNRFLSWDREIIGFRFGVRDFPFLVIIYLDFSLITIIVPCYL